MVIWLIGLSGAGKTTIAREVRRIWVAREPNTVLVDGDEIRDIMKSDQAPDSHTVAGRRRNAERMTALCKWLDQQNINVVCSILSIFPELRAENRTLFSNYFEVFIDAPLDALIERDTKNLYAPAVRGELENVVGIDIPFPRPEAADLTIDNSKDSLDAEAAARSILEAARAT